VSGSAVIQNVAAISTAIGAGFVAFQLALARRQLTAQFERVFVDKYERILANIPLSALLAGNHQHSSRAQRAFYDYFELCEEELYYRRCGKVSPGTWTDWWLGISINLSRPAFIKAWKDLNEVAETNSSPQVGAHAQFQLLRDAIRHRSSQRVYDSYLPRWRRFGRHAPDQTGYLPSQSAELESVQPVMLSRPNPMPSRSQYSAPSAASPMSKATQ
jgi:hypothetical protein